VAFLKYSLIRLALFAPLFVLFDVLGLGALMSVICAGLIAFAVSYLFFQKQRDEATAAIHSRFSGKSKPLRTVGEVEDAQAEDTLLDANPDITIRTDAKGTDAKGSDTKGTDAKSSDARGKNS
jgi:mannitol-specific phosphotransferase system IIBC component